jgi:hypothetical protein
MRLRMTRAERESSTMRARLVIAPGMIDAGVITDNAGTP